MVVPAAQLAVIDTDTCIGCMLCIPSCPTNAIEGEAKQAHKVIEANCTGCGLCLPVCPVDCITMLPTKLYAPAAQNTQGRADLPQTLQAKIAAARLHARQRHGR